MFSAATANLLKYGTPGEDLPALESTASAQLHYVLQWGGGRAGGTTTGVVMSAIMSFASLSAPDSHCLVGGELLKAAAKTQPMYKLRASISQARL